MSDITKPKSSRARYETIGHLMVDSGRILIGDPCHFPETEALLKLLEGRESEPAVQIGEEHRPPMYGGDMCEAVAVATGYGDGIYPVVARIRDGRVLSVHIDFDVE